MTYILGNPILVSLYIKPEKQELSPFSEYIKAIINSFLNAEVLLHGISIFELPKGYKIDSSHIFKVFILAISFLHSEGWVQTL